MLRAAGWGVYCASSWTWCIGMYLPIIMLRLFGWPGFLVFAIPNILGVIVFGFVFDAERSRRFLREHRTAMRVFSAVTTAYQLFFVAWLFGQLLPNSSPLIGALLGVGIWVLSLALAALTDRVWPILAVACAIVSWLLFANLGLAGLCELPMTGALTHTDLAYAAPGIIFGFALCPWLDGSFHRARVRSETASTFVVFAFAFAPMILFTAAYTLGGVLLASGVVLAHILIQASFTSAVHLRESWLGGLGAERDGASPWPWAALLPALAILPGALAATHGETFYLYLLSVFGLLFPAWVLFFIRPLGVLMPTRLSIALFVIAIIPCAWTFERGLMHDQTMFMPWSVGGLLCLWALTRIVARR